MIYLADKAPSPELIDYTLDMSEFIPEGFSIDEVTVEVTAAGNGESPLLLTVQNATSQPLTDAEGDDDNVVILFWLAGGTVNTRYRGVITMSDDESVDPDRKYVRQFEVEVKNL